MPSKQIPHLTFALLAVALTASIAGAAYGIWWNPELAFWNEAAKRKLAWSEKMRTEHGHVIGVVGGSTTMFAIDAEALSKEHGLPVANLGLGAGMGPDVCVGFGFAALQRGDILIVSLEPALLTEEVVPTTLGTQFARSLGMPELLSWGRNAGWRLRWIDPASFLPGGYHVATLLGKIALSKPLFRYSIEDAQPGGLQITSERHAIAREVIPAESQAMHLSSLGRALLERIRNEATACGITAAYVLPWAYCPPETSVQRRASHEGLLGEIAQILPVLKEPQLGILTDPASFSDSGQHLTAESARKRSREFAETLRGILRPQSHH